MKSSPSNIRILISKSEMENIKFFLPVSFITAVFFIWAPFDILVEDIYEDLPLTYIGLWISTISFSLLYLATLATKSCRLFMTCFVGFSGISPVIVFTSGISCLYLTLGTRAASIGGAIAVTSLLVAVYEYYKTDWVMVRRKCRKGLCFEKIDEHTISFQRENLTQFIRGYGHSYFPDSFLGRMEFWLSISVCLLGFVLYSYGNVEDEAFRGRMMVGGVWLIGFGWVARPMLVERMIAFRMITLKKRGEL